MNKILFLYTDPSDKEDLLLAAKAVRVVLRKFRKSASVSLFNIDTSPACRNEVKKILLEKVSDSDCIMFCGKKKNTVEEILFFKDCFGIHSSVYFSSGKRICYPVSVCLCKEKEGILESITQTDISAIEKTVKLAISSFSTKKELLLCTDSEKDEDFIICKEFEKSMANTREFSVEFLDFDEMISSFTGKIPSYDVILTTHNNARILATHINALNKFPAGYTVLYGDNVRIFKREVLPYEEFSNLSYASCLIACANMIENELDLKNAGICLRKAVTLTLEKCCFESRQDFQKHLLIEINAPIRHRKVKTNEGDN